MGNIKNIRINPAQIEALNEQKAFQQFMMFNRCAIREVETKLQVLDEEFSISADRNPIQTIKSRVKKTSSIVAKLLSRDLEITVSNMEEYLTDVAGVRVICPFIEDIYVLVDLLKKQDDITILQEKDYIKSPKPNGYRSLHLIVAMPIYLSTEKKYVHVEVQFRTIAMDFWASLEHQLKYKKKIENPRQIAEELKVCADGISEIDMRMQEIRSKIDEVQKNHEG